LHVTKLLSSTKRQPSPYTGWLEPQNGSRLTCPHTVCGGPEKECVQTTEGERPTTRTHHFCCLRQETRASQTVSLRTALVVGWLTGPFASSAGTSVACKVGTVSLPTSSRPTSLAKGMCMWLCVCVDRGKGGRGREGEGKPETAPSTGSRLAWRRLWPSVLLLHAASA